ncbi:Ig-like domain-containing protein, partial [Aeromonas hydrophila]|uniref:Ig-like domain-containing protein n=1 Tax=Aeromonas hydrophila TaxID=644 RepID=UPI0022AF24E4
IQDPAGNQSEKSDPIVIVVDTTAPNAPAIGSVIGDVGGKFVELVSGGATNDTTPTFKGTAEANARVDIFDNDVLIGSTVADAQGSWSFTPKALEEGDHSFITHATDAAGNTSAPSPAWNISVDVTAPSKPGTDGQGPGINDIGGVTNDNTPTFSGKSEPGDTIIILDNNQKIGEVVVGENGT